MAIKLPDIVQRVVLDTSRFSMGTKGVQKELASTAGKAGESQKALAANAKEHDSAGASAGRHERALTKVNRAVKSSAPSVLRLADNLYKVRSGHRDAGAAAAAHASKAGRLEKGIKRLGKSFVSGLKSAAKFGVKMTAIGYLILMALPAIGSMVGALGSLVASMGRAIGILPALSGGLIGLVAVAGVLVTAFSGVKDAMKAQSKAGGAAASTAKAVAKAQESGAKSIASAQKGVISAQKSLTQARVAEAEAYAEIAKVQWDAQRRIADSTRALYQAQMTLAESQSKTRGAQDKLSKSYDEAKKNLEELRRETERADIAQQRADQSLRSSQRALIDLLASGATDPEAMTDALLDLQSAELDAADAADDAVDTRDRLTDAEKKGINNSDAVLEARRELAEAQRDEADAAYELRDAEIDLMETQWEAADSVAEARKRAADATQDVVDAVDDLAEAEANLKEAQSDAAEGVADAKDSGASGGAGANEKPPSKEAVAIAAALKKAGEALKPIKSMIQALTFKGIIKGIEGGTRVLLGFKDEIGGTAKIIGDQFAKWPDYLALAAPSIRNIWKANNNLLDSVGELGGVMVIAGARMAEAGSFVLDHFAGVADDVKERMSNALANPETFAKMQAFFLRALGSAITWWRIMRDFAIGTIKFLGLGADEGDSMARSLEGVMAKFRAFTDDEDNRKKVISFFERARDLASKIGGFIWDIVVGVAGIATGPGMEALGKLFDRFGAIGGDDGASLSELITSLGTSVVVKSSEAIIGIIDALSGDKVAGTNAEKIAVAMTDLSELTGGLDTFADVLAFMVDKIKWVVENVPGAKGMIAGLAAAMVVGKISKTIGITGLLRGITSGAGFVINQRTGLPAVTREVKAANRAEGVSPTPGKSKLLNWINGVRNTSPKAATELGKLNTKVNTAGTEAETAASRASGASKKMEASTGRLKKLGNAAVGVSTGVGMAGGALWAMSSIVGPGALGDALNKIGAGMVLIGTVAEIGQTLGAFAGGMKAADGATKGMAASQKSLNLAFLSSPIFWIVAAIVAIGAALYLLYKKNEGFRNFIDGLWQSIQEAWDKILPVLKSVAAYIKDKVLVAFAKIWEVAKQVFEGVATVVGWAWETIIKPYFTAIWWYISNVTIPTFKLIWETVKVVFNAVAAIIGFVWNNVIKPYYTAIWWYITNVLVPIFKVIWAVVKDVFHMVGVWIGFVWNTFIKPIFTALWGFITNTLIPTFQKIREKAEVVWGMVSSAIQTAWDFIKPIFEKIKTWVEDYVVSPFETAATAVKDAWGGISGAVSGAFDGAKKALNTSLRAIGNLISPLLSGASKIADAVGMKNLSETLKDTSTDVGKWGEKADGGKVSEHASGHRRFGTAKRTPVGGGFKTGVPRAIVGEGSRHPEYVIPTDPKYRGRARSLIDQALGDMGRGPTGRYQRDLATGGRVPEFSLGGDLIDAARGLGASAIEKVWPKMPDKWTKEEFPVGVPGNLIDTLRTTVIDKIRGQGELKASLRDAAATAVAGAGATGLNPAFLDLYNRYNAASGNKFSITSGFRSYAQQAALYAAWMARVPGQAQAAPPGRSNHEKGLAIDHSPHTTAADRARAAIFGLRYPMSFEPWHVEPVNKADPYAGANLFPTGKDAGGLLDRIPGLADGGIVMKETLAKIGEFGHPEAIVPLGSTQGRKMLGDDGPSILIDMRDMQINTGDPAEVKKAIREGIDEALDAVADFVEIGVTA